jgi:3-deoxy-D-manno-octulosonic-acid transferase
MRRADAIRIVEPQIFADSLIAMLRDTEEARTLGERGLAVFGAQAGATARTVQALIDLLKGR